MRRLGTTGRGKTLKTSPPAVLAAATGTVFRAKTPGLGAGSGERQNLCTLILVFSTHLASFRIKVCEHSK